MTDRGSDSTSATSERRPRSKLRRLAKWSGITLATLAVLGVVAFYIATRSWFLVAIVQPMLSAKLGGHVAIESASFESGGKFRFHNVTLRAPGHVGTAAEILSIDDISVDVALTRLLRGSFRLTSVDIAGLHLRASEDVANPGRFSFMSLRPRWDDDDNDDKPPSLPPRIDIRDAIIEIGMHDGESYEEVGHRRLAGHMYPSSDDPYWFNFELSERDETDVEHGSAKGIVSARGRWNVKTQAYRASIDGLELDERAFMMCPQVGRFWWELMEPRGRIARTVLEWDGVLPPSAHMTVEDLAMTIPLQDREVWSRFASGKMEPAEGQPRMQADRGTIRLIGNKFSLERVRGQLTSSSEDPMLVGVPFSFDLEIPLLPQAAGTGRREWMDSMLRAAPFRMTLRMENFIVEQTDDGSHAAVEMPAAVAKVLEKFDLRHWQLETEVLIERAYPALDDDGRFIAAKPTSHGTARITNASARYFKFPYRLDDVDAFFEFDETRILVHYLTGKGSGDSWMHMTGEINELGRWPNVNLTVSAQNVPLDDRLREALNNTGRQVFDSLLHQSSYDSLRSAGVLADEAAIAAATASLEAKRAALAALQSQLDALTAPEQADGGERGEVARARDAEAPDAADVPSIHADIRQIQADVDRLQRIVDAGPFRLGGTIDLDILIAREAGQGQRTTTTGKIAVRNAGVVYEKFPYPVQVTGGVVDWRADRIVFSPGEIATGLQIVTPGGGHGRVEGELLIVEREGKRRVEPDLRIAIREDRLTEPLYAAIPLTRSERDRLGESASWPGRTLAPAAQLLKSLALQADFDYSGAIRGGPDGRGTYDFNVEFTGGHAAPTADMSATVSRLGLIWPEGFTLQDIDGRLRITPKAIELVDLHGRHVEGRVLADGRIDFLSQPNQTTFNVTFEQLPLGPYLLSLAPGRNVEKIRELWDRYQPSGTFDARLALRMSSEKVEPIELEVWPRTIHLTVDGRPVTLTREGGVLEIANQRISFDHLALRIDSRAGNDGAVTLDGSYGMGPGDSALQLGGTWRDGRMESPLLSEAIRLIGSEEQSRRLKSLNLAGLADIDFSYASPRGGNAASYAVAISPRSIALTVRETRIDAEIVPGGQVVFTPRHVRIDSLEGMLDGSRVGVSGIIDHSPLIDADLQVSYGGTSIGPSMRAILPAAVGQTIDALTFKTTGGISLTDGRLRLSQTEASDGQPRAWRSSFNGEFEISGGAFVAGLKFDKVDGAFALDLETEPGRPPRLRVDAAVSRMLTVDRAIRDVSATIMLSDDGRSVLIPDVRGRCYEGTIAASATAELGREGYYTTKVDMVGINLSRFVRGELPGAASAVQGELFGSMTLAGHRGREGSRHGRGGVRVVNGRLAQQDLMLRLLQLFHFMPPVAGDLDYADAAFYIDGDHAIFDRLSLENPTIALTGDGRIHLDTLQLDIRFRTRGRMAILSDLVSGVSDRLYGIEVTGPLNAPTARLIALPELSSRPTDATMSQAGSASGGTQ
jgi:hypothetical protein